MLALLVPGLLMGASDVVVPDPEIAATWIEGWRGIAWTEERRGITWIEGTREITWEE